MPRYVRLFTGINAGENEITEEDVITANVFGWII